MSNANNSQPNYSQLKYTKPNYSQLKGGGMGESWFPLTFIHKRHCKFTWFFSF